MNSFTPTIWKSHRGYPLIYMGPAPGKSPILTMENCSKWYGVILLHPSGEVEEVPFPGNFCDHVPDPDSFDICCEQYGYELDEMALEMVVGRWELEVKSPAPKTPPKKLIAGLTRWGAVEVIRAALDECLTKALSRDPFHFSPTVAAHIFIALEKNDVPFIDDGDPRPQDIL